MGCGIAKINQLRAEELQREKEKYLLSPSAFPENLASSFKAQRRPHHQVTHVESLRKVSKPPQTTRKSYAFHLPSTEWGMASDDHGNPYFYNYESGESSWTCPHELQHLDLPEHRLSFIVAIPNDAVPGEVFETEVDNLGFQVEVMCPIDASPGELLELMCPEDGEEVEGENYDYLLQEENAQDDDTEYDPFDEYDEPAIKFWHQFSEEKGLDAYTGLSSLKASNRMRKMSLTQLSYLKS